MDTQAVVNYCRMSDFSIRYYHYAYIDVQENLADQLFIKHKVRVYFGKEYQKDSEEYKVIFCKVKKKDQAEFLSALSELADKMLLLGHTDYIQYCKNAVKILGQ